MLTPIFEHIFSDNSFGFRPHREAQAVIAKVVNLYNQRLSTGSRFRLQGLFR